MSPHKAFGLQAPYTPPLSLFFTTPIILLPSAFSNSLTSPSCLPSCSLSSGGFTFISSITIFPANSLLPKTSPFFPNSTSRFISWSMKVFSFNACSLFSKLDELLLCSTYLPYLVCVNETWLSPDILMRSQYQIFNFIA